MWPISKQEGGGDNKIGIFQFLWFSFDPHCPNKYTYLWWTEQLSNRYNYTIRTTLIGTSYTKDIDQSKGPRNDGNPYTYQ